MDNKKNITESLRDKLNESLSRNPEALTENNLAIIGSRGFNNYSFAKKEILNIIKANKISITKIISGGASGADKIAEIFADKFRIPIEVIKPDWSKGKQAGMVRNSDIITKSNYVIAFWDGVSKGTLDSINKAKKANKKVFIVKVDPDSINEGVRIGDDGDYVFDFNKHDKSDIMTLKYNKKFVTKKTSNGLVSYFSFKTNKKVASIERTALIRYIKDSLSKRNEYEHLLNKAVIGLFNNPNFDVGDVDLILIPESGSNLNLDLATKIKNKIPNAMFVKDAILKNELRNVTINYDLAKEKRLDSKTIIGLEGMIEKATVDGVFKISKLASAQLRKFVINFLVLDSQNRQLLNKLVDGKVLVVDDFVSQGTTFGEVDKLIQNYAPREIILYSLIG